MHLLIVPFLGGAAGAMLGGLATDWRRFFRNAALLILVLVLAMGLELSWYSGPRPIGQNDFVELGSLLFAPAVAGFLSAHIGARFGWSSTARTVVSAVVVIAAIAVTLSVLLARALRSGIF